MAGYLPVIAACVIGIASGVAALALGAGINCLGSLRLFLCETNQALIVLPLFGLVGGLLSGCMLWIAPDTSGSGIPQVRAVLNRMSLPLNLRIAIVKLIGGTISLGAGLFMGREGPTVQVGASIAGQLSHWFPTSVEHRRHLIAAGAGAGLAAAFSAPIAGCIFVIEELLKDFKPMAVALTIVACFSAFFIEQTFGTPHRLQAHGIASSGVLTMQDLIFLILLGIASGFLGSLFNRGILLALRVFRKIPLAKPFKVGLAGLITGVVVALMPAALHNYAGTRAMIDAGTLSDSLVPVVFCAFSFLTFLAYGSGAPGGLFAPSLSLGSALGYMTGVAQQYWTGTGSIQLFALVGMGAFFAAVSRAPLTSIVIVFEMASDYTLVPPLMISCVIASAVGERFYKGGLYDLLMVWSGLHLERTDGEDADSKRASDYMKTDFEKVESGSKIKDAVALLEVSQLNSVPVVKNGKLVGVFTAGTQLADGQDDITIESVMRTPPLAVSLQDSTDELLFLFARHKFKWLPVTNKSEDLIGIVWQRDLIDEVFAAGSRE